MKMVLTIKDGVAGVEPLQFNPAGGLNPSVTLHVDYVPVEHSLPLPIEI